MQKLVILLVLSAILIRCNSEEGRKLFGRMNSALQARPIPPDGTMIWAMGVQMFAVGETMNWNIIPTNRKMFV